MPKIEKVLLGFSVVALVAAIASRLFFSHSPQLVLGVFYTVIISQIFLLGFYGVYASPIYRLIFSAFIIGWVGLLLELYHLPSWKFIYSFKYLAEVILGVLILIKLIHSYKQDGFQLFPFLLAVLIILPAAYSLILVFGFIPMDLGNASEVLYIPLIGVIFTLMTNSNLWSDYKKDEQHGITYMLIVIILPVAEFFIERYL